MQILTFTSLFPNKLQPTLGIFIYQRVAHYARRPQCSAIVVAPVPYFPHWLMWKPWRVYGLIPKDEQVSELHVWHPRYPLLPKVAMPFHGLMMFVGCLSSVWRLRKQAGFGCIDAHFVYPDCFAAVLLGKILKIPVICSARGTDIAVYPSYRLIRPQIRWALRKASGVIAVSESLKQTMVDLGIPAEKIRVIGNGVDLERFGPMDRHAARQQLGLPENDPILVSVASLQPYKGHQLLIAAITEIRARIPNLKLYILGEGPFRRPLDQLIAQESLSDRVFLKGNRPNEELKLWYNAANLSCLVSEREGWPNVLLESIGCGTPVLASRVGGIPEVISSPDLGILVEQSVPAVAIGLETALQKQWDRQALVQYARKRSWGDVAAEMEHFILECV
jgi:teichuronic acid biosynthesis glycosyltransferase TuaC